MKSESPSRIINITAQLKDTSSTKMAICVTLHNICNGTSNLLYDTQHFKKHLC